MIEQLVHNTLTAKGFDLQCRWNTLQPEWASTGWPLALPAVNWTERTRLVLHFQDRITPTYNGCKELDAIEQFYGSNSKKVVVVYYSHGLDKIYQGPIQLVNFSTHNYLTITDLLKIKDQWINAFDQPKTKPWQCLNGRTCEHRYRVADLLKTWPSGTLSYGTEIPLATWDYGTYRGTENYENFVRLLPLYQHTAVNIVTETDYHQRPGVICEKTLYAFVAKQIPVIVGHPGAVQDARDLGFDTFDDLVDTSYDWLPNEIRAEQAVILNQDLILGFKDLSLYQQRICANQEHALTKLLDQMIAWAQQDLDKVF